MDKMKTLSIAKQNKEEILEYVMHDSLALKDVYKKLDLKFSRDKLVKKILKEIKW